VGGPPLVTGATGFAGSHLIEHLFEFEPRVAAWANPRGAPPGKHARPDDRVIWNAVDLLDRRGVAAAIAELQPSVIYHCGGAADEGGAWADPAKPLQVNALGTHHILDAVRLAALTCPVLVTGSALIYCPSSAPIAEDDAIGPSSPYGLSKLAQEMVAARATWCPVFLSRPFNHAGPRQSSSYVTSSFARQIAEIEARGTEPVLHVGNLDARRDITDVRDVVRAYRMLVESGRPGRPYNICSGQAHRIGDLLEMLCGLSTTLVRVEVDPSRMRPSDNPVVRGDASRILAETGWRPAITLEQTLKDLLDYWRRRAAA
jgi:GDP-4-dehydro-6-deoxy-D-mannose reductase